MKSRIVLLSLFLIFMLVGCFQLPCPTYEDRFRKEILLRLQQRQQFKRQNRKLKCRNSHELNDQVKVHATDYYVSNDSVCIIGSVLYFPEGSDVLTSTGKK